MGEHLLTARACAMSDEGMPDRESAGWTIMSNVPEMKVVAEEGAGGHPELVLQECHQCDRLNSVIQSIKRAEGLQER
jgi:hypothetical protein